jgi:hypothetical protein
MSASNDKTKLAQFDEFFSIDYRFNINVSLLSSEQLPSYEQFLEDMPAPFKIVSEITTLDQSSLRPLQAVAGVANQLMVHLNHQAKKIDLLLGYILSQQDVLNDRYKATKFGGGGVIFDTDFDSQFTIGDYLTLKLFFSEDNSALYCIGEIVDIDKSERKQHKVVFHHIREEDRELLVRNSLHQQSKQLQALTQQRNQTHKADY